MAGGAWSLGTTSAATIRSTIRRRTHLLFNPVTDPFLSSSRVGRSLVISFTRNINVKNQ